MLQSEISKERITKQKRWKEIQKKEFILGRWENQEPNKTENATKKGTWSLYASRERNKLLSGRKQNENPKQKELLLQKISIEKAP